MDHITNPLGKVNVQAAAKMFGVSAKDIQRAVGQVDLLIGIQAAGVFPTVEEMRGNL